MRLLLVAIASMVFANQLLAQSVPNEAEAEWVKTLEAANQEYFAKIEQLRKEHIEKLELLRKEATFNDELDVAVKLRDLMESHKTKLGDKELPEEKGKLAKDKLRLANILRSSKWNCENHPHFPKWAGKHLIFHENGTMVPANDPNAKMPHHRWAIVDGRHIVGLLGNFLVVFRLTEQENALDVFELANVLDFKTKRASVQTGPLARSPRDEK